MIGIVWGSKNYQTVVDWLIYSNLPHRLVKTALDVEGIDVAIFCGGPDLGENVERDDYEKEIFQLCQDRDISILGICRGMQVVSHWLGAALVSDLGEKIHDKNDRFLLVQSHPEMDEMRQTEIAVYCIQWMQKRMDVALLKRMYAINSKSGHEQEITAFVLNRLRSLPITIYQDAFGNVLITKGEAECYPCVAAHLDEVHLPSNRYIQETNGRLWAVGDEHYPIGIGADDKNGIWVVIKLLETSSMPMKAILTVQEEKDNGIAGCRGANHCDLSWFEDVKYIIECDRKGKGDLVTVGKRQGVEIRLCEDDWISMELQQKYGYNPVVGGSTDVVLLKVKGLSVPVCNLSCGYYNAHNDGEYTIYSELENCLELVKEIINVNENVNI